MRISNVPLLCFRYDSTVRVIIFSGSLTVASWEQVQQFGWYVDANITGEDAVDVDTTPVFARDLNRFVATMLQSKQADILRGTDFSHLSPVVCLVASIQGTTLD